MGENSRVVTMQIQDPEGNVVEEKHLVLSEGDSLIFKFEWGAWSAFTHMTEDEKKVLVAAFKRVSKPGGILLIPEGIDVFVLHKEFGPEQEA